MGRTLEEIDAAPAPWPTELRVSPDRTAMTVGFDDGQSFEIPAELLRVESPSAEVQGHSPTQKQLVAGKRNVKLVKADPNGNYAVRLHFDDSHSTGIFSWRYLRFLGENRETLMADYLDALDEAGLSRDG